MPVSSFRFIVVGMLLSCSRNCTLNPCETCLRPLCQQLPSSLNHLTPFYPTFPNPNRQAGKRLTKQHDNETATRPDYSSETPPPTTPTPATSWYPSASDYSPSASVRPPQGYTPSTYSREQSGSPAPGTPPISTHHARVSAPGAGWTSYFG